MLSRARVKSFCFDIVLAGCMDKFIEMIYVLFIISIIKFFMYRDHSLLLVSTTGQKFSISHFRQI